MDIYKEIDMIFSGEAHERPKWAEEILNELKEIKILLKNRTNKEPTSSSELYKYINLLRESMKADKNKSINYKGKEFSINAKGLLYNKNTFRIIPKDEAFEVYKYAFNQNKYAKNVA